MNWLDRLDADVQHDVVLAPLTRFGLGGPARCMVHPADTENLTRLRRLARENGAEVRVLGGGANLLIRDDGVDGVVIRLDAPFFRHTVFDGPVVTAGGGVPLMELTHQCCRRGLAGIEGLAGIPGTVGGAVVMNAGGRFGEIGQAVTSVEVVEDDGTVRTLDRQALKFGYRSSAVGDRPITRVRLRLSEQEPRETLAAFQELWRIKERAQPLAAKSAGCVFKNPPDVSAGSLIDSAGLKGARCGAAGVSERHANFIVTERGATTADVLRLIERVRRQVRRTSGIELELEVRVW